MLRGEFEPDPRAGAGLAASPGSPPPATVEKILTSDVRTARETDVLEIAELMTGRG